MLRQQDVERMTGDTETLTDVLTLKRGIDIELLRADGSINRLKESSVRLWCAGFL